jgi:putative flippase GtrA
VLLRKPPRLSPGVAALGSGLAVSLFATCLFWRPNSAFYDDWSRHEWCIAYFRRYMLDNGSIPEIINTAYAVGVPLPLFYAGKFYAFAGVLALPVGSYISLRLICFASLLLQCLNVYRTVFLLNRNPALAAAITAFCGLSVYQLTNLYNRGDITEFVAYNLLLCSICCLLNLIFAEPRSNYDRFGWGLYLSAACLTHPLTGCFGFGLLVAPLLAIYLFVSPSRQKLLVVIGGTSLVALALAPWLLLLVTLAPDTHIFSSLPDLVYIKGLDDVLVRFWPLPLDLRSIRGGVGVSTPYLDAQLNAPLLILFVFLSGLRLRQPWRWTPSTFVWGAACLIFTATVLVSVVPPLGRWLTPLVHILQFAYRLVNFSNAALFVGAAGLLADAESQQAFRQSRISSSMIAACLLLAVVGTLAKLAHAAAIIRPNLLAETPLLEFKHHGLPDYDITDGVNVLPQTPSDFAEIDATLPVSTAPFGNAQTLSLSVPSPSQLWTDIRPFPWNKVILDGEEVPPERLYVKSAIRDERAPKQSKGFGILVGAGDHRIGYAFDPAKNWRLLNVVSWITLAIWTSVMGLICAKRCSQCFRRSGTVGVGCMRQDHRRAPVSTRLHDLRVEGLRLLRFGLVGIIATATYSIVTLVAIEAFDVSPVPASVLGVAASIGVSYFGHTLYSFRVTLDHATFVWRFLILAGASLLITTGLMWLLSDVMQGSHRLAIAVIAVLIPVFNYICNRFWVFRTAMQRRYGLQSQSEGPHRVHSP